MTETLTVTTGRVRFMRRTRDGEYQHIEAEADLSFDAGVGGDGMALARTTIAAAKTLVNEALGKDQATRAAQPSTAAAPPATEAPKPRGGKGKATTAAASDIPDAGATAATTAAAPQISTNPENRVDPTDIPDAGAAAAPKPTTVVASDIPDGKPAVAAVTTAAAPVANGVMTPEGLRVLITASVNEKKIPVADVKSILASFGATRPTDVAADKVEAVRAKIMEKIDEIAITA